MCFEIAPRLCQHNSVQDLSIRHRVPHVCHGHGVLAAVTNAPHRFPLRSRQGPWGPLLGGDEPRLVFMRPPAPSVPLDALLWPGGSGQDCVEGLRSWRMSPTRAPRATSRAAKGAAGALHAEGSGCWQYRVLCCGRHNRPEFRRCSHNWTDGISALRPLGPCVRVSSIQVLKPQRPTLQKILHVIQPGPLPLSQIVSVVFFLGSKILCFSTCSSTVNVFQLRCLICLNLFFFEILIIFFRKSCHIQMLSRYLGYYEKQTYGGPKTLAAS